MTNRTTMKFIHEGKYAVEVPLDLIDDDEGWGPYVSPQEAKKLDDARLALRAGDLPRAAKFGKVFELRLIALPGEAAE
jgi:hypothetical protein